MNKNEELSVNLEDINVDSVFDVKQPVPEDLESSKIQVLAPKHQRVIHMYLSGGYTTQEIATANGYSKTYTQNLLRTPNIKAIIEEIQLEEDDLVRQSIKALRMKAMKKMSTLMDSSMDAVALQAAKDVLDRTGHKGADKKEVTVNMTFDQQLKEILGTKSNINISDYDIIDIEE